MDLIQELIDELTHQDVDLASTLRKAIVLTNDFHSPELDEWMNSELNGYSGPQEVPEYRRFPAQNFGDYTGLNEGIATNVFIRTDDLPEEVKEFAETLVISEGVGTLRGRGEEPESKNWPPDLVESAQSSLARDGGMFLTRAYQSIPAPVYQEIFEQVRNKLLTSLLDIQRENRAEDPNIPETPQHPEANPDAVGRPVNIVYGDQHNYGDHNVVAAGEQVNQQVTMVQKNDVDSLLAHLRERGVEEEDLQEIKNAVAAEPEAPDGNYGPKVRDWLERMATKAANGLWQVGSEAAPKILEGALRSFY